MNAPFEYLISSPDQPTVLDVEGQSGDGGQARTFAAGQRVGPYRIERVLGEGGMGTVYLAQQLEPLQRPVALKLMRSQLQGGTAEAYFLVERQALARMDHPAIAKVYDAGTTPQGHPFFAMEWIDGPTLANYFTTHKLGQRDILQLFIRLCRGVQHAHQKGVIHRDLKPSNVLISQVDGQPMPKIIDFGIAIGATRNDGSGKSPAQRAGTHGYMSPEQVRGDSREIDIRSDVFALGAMLRELLAPRSARQATSAASDTDQAHDSSAVFSQHGENAARQDSGSLFSVPIELRCVLARATDAQRNRRYESAQALADDLEKYLAHYPLAAVPDTRAYRLRKFARRNRGSIIAVCLVSAALIVGTGAAIVSMLHARSAALRATQEAQKANVTSRFLTDVLSGVDPEQARDLDKTLLHLVLNRAAARASRELAGQPEVLADIESTIGASYESLSEYKKALEYARKAYANARKQLGDDALTTLQIQAQLARLLYDTGDTKQAAGVIAENVARLTRTRGADDLETLRSRLKQVQIKRQLGDFAGAEREITAMLPTVARVTHKDDRLAIDTDNVHASLLTDQGHYRRAEPIFHDVIARETRLWGADDPRTLDSMNDFAIMYLESQRFAKGAEILKSMLPICEKIYGPDHGFTINIVANLAGALRQQGTPDKIAASGPYYKRALEAARKTYGPRHPNTIIATHNYANYLLDIGDVDGAVSTQQQALAAAREALGVNHPVTGEIEFGLGKALLRAKQYPGAEQALLAAIKEKQHDFGPDHWRMAGYMDPLITLYTAWGKPQKAAEWQRRRAELKPKPKADS